MASSSWARWPHQPPTSPQQDPKTKKPFRRIGAKFRNLAKGCTEDAVTRGRKLSEFCIVPLTEAVTILVEKYCHKHPACVKAGFTTGDCCPAQGIISRCCCSHQISTPIFLDETKDVVLEWRFEYLTIRSTEYLTWITLGSLIVLMVFSRNTIDEQAAEWSNIINMLRPLQKDLQEYIRKNKVMKFFFIAPKRGEMPMITIMKYSIICVFGFFIGGGGVWVIGAIICAYLVMQLLSSFSRVLRYCVSPMDPKDPVDMRIQKLWAKYPIRNDAENGGFQKVPVAKLAEQTGAGAAAGAGYFVKMFLDMMLMRLIVSLMVMAIFGKDTDKGFYKMMNAQILGRNNASAQEQDADDGAARRLTTYNRLEADRDVLLQEFYFWRQVLATASAPLRAPVAHGLHALRNALAPVLSLLRRLALFPGFAHLLLVALSVSPDAAGELLGRRLSDMVSVDETDQAPPMEMLELEQVFEVLPNFAQPFKGIAMIVWGFIQEALGSFSKLLGMIFGVPLCEGPAVLIACMMITAVTGGLFFWLNFDQLGLLDAGKRAIRST